MLLFPRAYAINTPFYTRTIPNISQILQPLEDAIRRFLIPSLTNGGCVTDDERLLHSLSVRLGGMGLISTHHVGL